MKERLFHIAAAAMIVLFVNFSFSNTAFMHIHVGPEGLAVTHSHPYSQGASHSHTSDAFAQIAAFNIASVSSELSQVLVCDLPESPYVVIECPDFQKPESFRVEILSLRAPPYVSF